MTRLAESRARRPNLARDWPPSPSGWAWRRASTGCGSIASPGWWWTTRGTCCSGGRWLAAKGSGWSARRPRAIMPVVPPGFPAILAVIFRIGPDFPQNVLLLKSVSIAAMLAVGPLTYCFLTEYRRGAMAARGGHCRGDDAHPGPGISRDVDRDGGVRLRVRPTADHRRDRGGVRVDGRRRPDARRTIAGARRSPPPRCWCVRPGWR